VLPDLILYYQSSWIKIIQRAPAHEWCEISEAVTVALVATPINESVLAETKAGACSIYQSVLH